MGRCVGRCCTPLDATSAPGGQQQWTVSVRLGAGETQKKCA